MNFNGIANVTKVIIFRVIPIQCKVVPYVGFGVLNKHYWEYQYTSCLYLTAHFTVYTLHIVISFILN